jgi:hypothetical protein
MRAALVVAPFEVENTINAVSLFGTAEYGVVYKLLLKRIALDV